MAVAIAANKLDHAAQPDAHRSGPVAGTAPPPRGASPFAALLDGTQAQASRRARAPLSGAAAASRSDAAKPQPSSPPANARVAGAKGGPAATQRPSEHPAPAVSPNGKAEEAAPSAKASIATSKANTAPESSAGNIAGAPPPMLEAVAAAPNILQNADTSAEADGDAQAAAIDEQYAASAATAVSALPISPVISDADDPVADPDAPPAASPAMSLSKAALQASPSPPGSDAATADGALLLHAALADPAAAPQAEQAVSQSAHTPPSAADWADARETVAVRVDQAVQDGVQNVSIDLHPAELGHVGIELSFHASGVSVQMTLSRQDTYEAFSRDRAALEQQLAQTGINLGSGGLDLRFEQKRDQPPTSSASASAMRMQPARPGMAAHPSARLRPTQGLLNIIA